jgi:hypothetical protein
MELGSQWSFVPVKTRHHRPQESLRVKPVEIERMAGPGGQFGHEG